MRDALVEWSPAFAAGGILILLGILVGRYPGVFWAFIFVTFFGAIAAELLVRRLGRKIAGNADKIQENSDKIQFLMLHLGLEEKYKRSQDPLAFLDDLSEGNNARMRHLKPEVEALRSHGGGKPQSNEPPKK